MKGAVITAIVLAAGALLAYVALPDSGAAGLSWGGHRIEIAIPVLIVVVAALYLVLHLLARAWRIRRSGSEAGLQQRRESAQRQFLEGMMQMSEGNWSAAEERLSSSAEDSDSPHAHFLGAARAAELMGAWERRDQWLSRALETASGVQQVPVLITQAEIYLKHSQLPQALAALQKMEAAGETNARGLALLARIYRQMSDWEALRALEPRLRGMRGVPESFVNETVVQIHLDRINAAMTALDDAQLKNACDEIPKPLLQTPEVVIAKARALVRLGKPPEAERVLRELLDHNWDEEAAVLYGELETVETLDTLQVAERWLRERATDPGLLLACARLCVRAELYGKARSYLEASVAIKPRLDAYQLLASLSEDLGDRERALKVLNDALIHAIGRKPNLPKVRARRPLERRQIDRRRR